MKYIQNLIVLIRPTTLNPRNFCAQRREYLEKMSSEELTREEKKPHRDGGVRIRRSHY